MTWTPSVLRWGFLYGGLIGAFVVPLAYLVLLQKIGLKKPFAPALVGTLVGGFLGATLGSGWEVLGGILGFLAGLAFVASRMTSASAEESRIAMPQGHESGKINRRIYCPTWPQTSRNNFSDHSGLSVLSTRRNSWPSALSAVGKLSGLGCDRV